MTKKLHVRGFFSFHKQNELIWYTNGIFWSKLSQKRAIFDIFKPFKSKHPYAYGVCICSKSFPYFLEGGHSSGFPGTGRNIWPIFDQKGAKSLVVGPFWVNLYGLFPENRLSGGSKKNSVDYYRHIIKLNPNNGVEIFENCMIFIFMDQWVVSPNILHKKF